MYLGHWNKSRKMGPNTTNHGHRYTESHEVYTERVKLQMSHQMKPYASVKAI